MKNNILKNNQFVYVLLLVLVCLCITLAGCDSSDNDSDSDAPQIPPASTMVIDFDDFQAQGSQSLTSAYGPMSLLSYTNWGHAALSAGVWNSLITAGLTVPVAVFLESFNHDPEKLSDGLWAWTYDLWVGSLKYTAKLTGQLLSDKVQWEMFISKAGDYTEFNWFSGENNLLITQGEWILRNSPDDPADFIRIDWNRNNIIDTGNIRYTNIVPNGPENGGYIFYGNDATGIYNAYYDIYDKGAENLTDIEWNTITKEGRVKDSRHFGDDDWHYWDENFQNINEPFS